MCKHSPLLVKTIIVISIICDVVLAVMQQCQHRRNHCLELKNKKNNDSNLIVCGSFIYQKKMLIDVRLTVVEVYQCQKPCQYDFSIFLNKSNPNP